MVRNPWFVTFEYILTSCLLSAIVAGPDDKWGERPFAYVVLKPGKSLTAEALIAHCRKYLAGYKVN